MKFKKKTSWVSTVSTDFIKTGEFGSIWDSDIVVSKISHCYSCPFYKEFNEDCKEVSFEVILMHKGGPDKIKEILVDSIIHCDEEKPRDKLKGYIKAL